MLKNTQFVLLIVFVFFLFVVFFGVYGNNHSSRKPHCDDIRREQVRDAINRKYPNTDNKCTIENVQTRVTFETPDISSDYISDIGRMNYDYSSVLPPDPFEGVRDIITTEN